MKPKLEKTLLKEKLLNYQKQIQTETKLQIEVENLLSQKSVQNYFSLKDLNSPQKSSSQQIDSQAYLKYLSQFTFKGDTNCQKSDLTRQNIQAMNKKTKLIRSSYYQSPSNFQLAIKISNSPYKDLIRKSLTSKTSQTIPHQNYGNNSFRLHKSSQKSENYSQFLTIKKSKCQTIERPYQYIRRSASAMTTKKHSKQISRAKTAHQIQREQNQSKKNPEKQQSLTLKNCNEDVGFIMNQFKPKLKAKYLQDNIKVMASIIKRKMGLMNGDEIYRYVNKLSNKRQTQELWSPKKP